MDIKCCVVGETGLGPDLFFVIVRCEERESGKHYEIAKAWAADLCHPLCVIDDSDPGCPVMELAAWESMTIITEHGTIANDRALVGVLLEAIRDLLDQLEAIGVCDWHGAEGLSLAKARAAVAAAKLHPSVGKTRKLDPLLDGYQGAGHYDHHQD